MPTEPLVVADYWSLSPDALLKALRADPSGLTTVEAERRLAEVGPNVLRESKRVGPLRLFLKQFTSPLVLILLFAAVVSAFVQEWIDAAVILAIVFGSALITTWQEYAAHNAVAQLRARLVHQVIVLRDGKASTIAAEALVPGDVLQLSAGSLLAADCVVLDARDFFVNQAVLTGETFPVQKSPGAVAQSATLSQRTNTVFMGTTVRSGTARALVVQTGPLSVYGQIADRLNLRPPETEFERGIRTFGLMLTQVMVVLLLVVFAMNVLTQKPPLDSLLFALALAVGISPELLPAVITINLSYGARAMAARGVIVRQLSAIETFGSMNVLCTDKTGTLTEGVVKIDAAVDATGTPSDDVFRLAFLNATLQTGLANPLDEAIASSRALDVSQFAKVDEIPYDFVRKRLSVVVAEAGQPKTIVTKGAVDHVLSVCTTICQDASPQPLDADARARLGRLFDGWSAQGYRVLGVCTRTVGDQPAFTRDDERDMVFEGFLLFLDPPKVDAREAIAALTRLGVRLKVITGDNAAVASHVAESVGLSVEGVLSGTEINTLRDEALWHRVDHTDLFVDVDPNQKERIISALQKMGHVVGYMGDGINDAPALYAADVGLSVESAVDVAREAADLVLLRPELDILRYGIEEGRTTFANSLKYIFTTTSANFGNMLSMAGASFFLSFLPLLPKQILLNNFMSDIPALTIARDNVDPEWIAAPLRWNVKFIRNFMILFGLVSSFFDFLTFGLLIYVVHASEAQFQTGWFVESLLTELLVAMVVRTRRPFYRSRPGRLLAISTAVVVILALLMPYLPSAALFGFVPLPARIMALILAITLAYVLTAEVVKHFAFRRAWFAV